MKINSKNKISYILFILIFITFISLFIILNYYNSCECKECEGMNDGSYCIPNPNHLFYLRTKLGKNLHIDKDYNLTLDTLAYKPFYVKGCLRNIFKITYLRYNPNSTNFTNGFTLVTVNNKMSVTLDKKDLKKSNEDTLFIKRVDSANKDDDYVRVGIIHNKKKYWYNETEEGDWLWTTNLKKASSFKIIYI